MLRASPVAHPLKRAAAWVSLLALLVALPYLPTLANGYVWDDLLHIASNPRIEHWSDAFGYFTRLEGLYYRPLVFLTYAVEYALWGRSALGSHSVNLLLHLLNVTLLVALARRSGLSPGAALLAGGIFGLHPLQSEAVAYVSGRTDLLMTTGALLGWLALSLKPQIPSLKKGGQGGFLRIRRRIRFLPPLATGEAIFVAAPAVALAILSKESGYALLLLLPWLAWRRGRTWQQRLLLAGPSLAVGIMLLLLRPGGVPWRQGPGNSAQKLVGAGCTLSTYLSLLAWPANLQVDRLTPMPDSVAGLVLSLGLVAAAIASVVWGISRRGAVADWTAWTLAFYLPAANVIPLYPAIAERAVFTPEHNLYAPLAGVGVLGAVALDRMCAAAARQTRRLLGAAVLGLIVLWGVRTAVRSRDWREQEHLFAQAAAAGSISPRVWYNLGNVLLQRRALAEAVRTYEHALQLAPLDAELWGNLGVALQQQSSLDAALAAYRQAVALAPANAQLYENLGSLHIARGDLAAARDAYSRALRLDPGRVRSRQALAAIDAARQ